MPIDEWARRVPNELAQDAVGLHQIIPSMRQEFGVDSETANFYIRTIIVDILNRGAFPVTGVANSGGYWRRLLEYAGTNEEIADRILAEWPETRGDPDWSGLWFAMPDMILDPGDLPRSGVDGGGTGRSG